MKNLLDPEKECCHHCRRCLVVNDRAGEYMKKVLGVLVIAAGVGYLRGGIGCLLIPDFEAEISIYTYIGEVVLLFWLLIRGWKVAKPEG